MGLFSKKSKTEDANASKESKPKRGFFGGKKKDLTLLERMQLEESVAAASLSVVQELADGGHSAVREVDEGLIIVAITNEMLEAANLDPSSEEFGSFAEALRAETVESIALAGDLADGVVGIIPSQETLTSLDEFDFVHQLSFKWAIVPFDLGDDGRLKVLPTTVHLSRLVEMAHNPTMQLEIKDGEVVEVDADDAIVDIDEDDDFVDEPALDVGDTDESELVGQGDEFDDAYPTDLDEDDYPSYEEDPDEDGYIPDDEFDERDADVLEVDADAEGFGNTEDGLTAEETKESINRVANHAFSNTELGLAIDMRKFDDFFDSMTLAQFDATRYDDSELQSVLSKLRQDANTELTRFHQDNIQTLRNKFITSMRDIHNKLVESLDHKDKDTTYGHRYYEIEGSYQEAMADLERHIAGEVKKINAEYTERREEYAENARREALAVYDSRYRDERNRKIDGVKDTVSIDFKTNRDAELGELYKDRRTVAERLFDKATTSLLQKLQDEFQAVSQIELQMYDAFRKDMDAYLRKHFADEVLRAKAEAEKLKQSHEAERVRQEYEQMLLTKARQLDEEAARSKESLRQLEQEHRDQVARVQADYERRIEREQKDNQNMRDMLQEATRSNSIIGEQKDKEIEHRLKLYQDTIAAKEVELKYANDRATSSQRPMKFIIGAVAAVTLALGIIFGFLMGANSTTPQQATPASAETDTVSYQYEVSTPVHTTDASVDHVTYADVA